MRRAALICAAAAIFCTAAQAFTAAQALAAPTVAIAGDADGALAERLRTELGARGFEVQAAPAFDPADPVPPQLAAILRVLEARARVEVWTPEADGASARFRTTIAAQGPGDPTLAVRAAEGMRAFVTAPVETVPAPPPPAAAGPPVQPSPAPAPPVLDALAATPSSSTSGLALGVDAALLVPVGGPTTGGAAQVRLRYRLSRRLGVGARFLLSVVPPSVSNAEGTTSLDANLLAAELGVGLLDDHGGSRWDARLIAGVGLAWLRLTGIAGAPFYGRRDDIWTALPYGAFEVSRRLSPHLALRASLLAGVAAPSATIRFAGVAVSQWGAPLVLLALGADFEL